MTNYFEQCKTSEELKATYKELVLKFHPDIYGEKGNDILKDVHNQLEKALKNIDRKTYDALYNDNDIEESEEIRARKEEIAREVFAKHHGLAYQYLFAAYWANGLHASNHRNPLTNHNFSGWNVWQLELQMLLSGYQSTKWSTFAQYKTAKNNVRKGQHGTYITLAIISKAKDENGEEDESKEKVYYKAYAVFNEEQTNAGATEKAPAQIEEVKKIEFKKEATPEQAQSLLAEVREITEQMNIWNQFEVVA